MDIAKYLSVLEKKFQKLTCGLHPVLPSTFYLLSSAVSLLSSGCKGPCTPKGRSRRLDTSIFELPRSQNGEVGKVPSNHRSKLEASLDNRNFAYSPILGPRDFEYEVSFFLLLFFGVQGLGTLQPEDRRQKTKGRKQKTEQYVNRCKFFKYFAISIYYFNKFDYTILSNSVENFVFRSLSIS